MDTLKSKVSLNKICQCCVTYISCCIYKRLPRTSFYSSMSLLSVGFWSLWLW